MVIFATAIQTLGRSLVIWLGTLVVVILSSVGVSVMIIHINTAMEAPSAQSKALLSVLYAGCAFLLLAAITGIAGTAGYAVTECAGSYALLGIVGVQPRQLVAVVLAQLTLLGIVGGGLGVTLGALGAGPLLDATMMLTHVSGHLEPHRDLWVLLGAALAVILLTILGGARAAFRAGRVSPLSALGVMSSETAKVLMSPGRWVLTLVIGGVVMALCWGITGTPVSPGDGRALSGAVGLSMLLLVALSVLLTLLAPVLFATFVRLWTALIPASASVSWSVARNSVFRRISAGATLAAPVLIGIAVPTGFFTIVDTAQSLSGVASGTGTNSGAIITILAPALLLSTCGAATVVLMTGIRRRRRILVLRALGSPERVAVGIALCESLITVLSGWALALGMSWVVGAMESLALKPGRVEPSVALGHSVIAAAAVGSILAVTALIPALFTRGPNLAAQLAQV